MSIKTPLIAAVTLASILGTTLTASADSTTRVLTAPAISTVAAPCLIEPCGGLDLRTKPGRGVMATGTGAGTPDTTGSIRWPWEKKDPMKPEGCKNPNCLLVAPIDNTGPTGTAESINWPWKKKEKVRTERLKF